MDAIKFIEERKRMCKTFNSECNGCPYSDFEKCEEGRKRWLKQPAEGE